MDGLLEMFDVPVYVHRDEEELITDPILNQSKVYTNGYTFTKAKYVEDKEVLNLIGYSFQVIHTPGHTKGGACYYVKEEDVLFSGDTLFYASVGRTDFPTGSTSELIRSIREKLMCLSDDTIVYPDIWVQLLSVTRENKILSFSRKQSQKIVGRIFGRKSYVPYFIKRER